MKLTYTYLKKQRYKIIVLKNGSSNCKILGDMILSLGHDKEKSSFIYSQYGSILIIDRLLS